METIHYLLKYNKKILMGSRVEKIGYLYIFYMISRSIGAITSMKKKDIKNNIFYYVKGLSFIKNKIKNEKSKFRLKIKEELNEPIIENSLHIFDKLPDKQNSNDIIRLITQHSK